jgi:hypothetical protein
MNLRILQGRRKREREREAESKRKRGIESEKGREGKARICFTLNSCMQIKKKKKKGER